MIQKVDTCLSPRAYARKKGRNNVTVDDLVHVITPKGRGEHFYEEFFCHLVKGSPCTTLSYLVVILQKLVHFKV